MPIKKEWNEDIDRYTATQVASESNGLTGSETGDVPENWQELSNGNAPKKPKVTPVAGGHVPTSATKWKKVETKPEAIPQNEERLNRFQRENKRRKEGR